MFLKKIVNIYEYDMVADYDGIMIKLLSYVMRPSNFLFFTSVYSSVFLGNLKTAMTKFILKLEDFKYIRTNSSNC